MDSRLLDALRNAPSLDLYELSLAINQMLTDPVRMLAIRQHLHPGAPVMFFDHRRGALMPGRVLQLRQTQVCVKDDTTHSQWLLPYAAIVADTAQRSAQPPVAPAVVDMAAFMVGDTAGFTDKHLRERIGTIVRLNDKTVSLLCDGERWRVSPRILRKIIDV